jgi:transcription initiation factor TFIIB
LDFNPQSFKEDDTITTKATYPNQGYRQTESYNKEQVQSCPFCNCTETVIDHQRAEVSCARCGLVLEENIIDQGPEWRAFDHDQHMKRTRAGAPATYAISDKGLSTVIDHKNKDSHGRKIPEKNIAQLYRIRKWNKRLRISRAGERNLAFALSELERQSSTLGIPRSVREDAAFIYRKAARRNLIRGRSIEGVVATSLYTACRRGNIPRTLDEISGVSKVSKKQIGKTYRFLSRELKIKLHPTSPSDYIPRFASKLGLSGKVQSKAIEIIRKAKDCGLSSGKGPTGLAAAAIYIASVLLSERKTQRDVADVAGVTEVTIRNRYKELSENIEMGITL